MILMEVGDFAKYKNTGTVGKVSDIMTEGDVTWVLLDVTDLYYDDRTLESASADEYVEITYKDKERKGSVTSVEDYLNTLKEINIEDLSPSGT